mmetsp:Transcript_16873/g.64260  ORF Transcript_16873/g.64260 Transcript_16873/m.64260 type:complete len:91 (+) Transcript_16873:857-1129(+)
MVAQGTFWLKRECKGKTHPAGHTLDFRFFIETASRLDPSALTGIVCLHPLLPSQTTIQAFCGPKPSVDSVMRKAMNRFRRHVLKRQDTDM